MAYDEHSAERIHRILKDRKVDYFAKNMFGGLMFMIDGGSPYSVRCALARSLSFPIYSLLYEVLLGASQGPRFGGFIALYGVDETIALIDEALAGKLTAA